MLSAEKVAAAAVTFVVGAVALPGFALASFNLHPWDHVWSMPYGVRTNGSPFSQSSLL
jgi:hypothetical protein